MAPNRESPYPPPAALAATLLLLLEVARLGTGSLLLGGPIHPTGCPWSALTKRLPRLFSSARAASLCGRETPQVLKVPFQTEPRALPPTRVRTGSGPTQAR